MKVDFHCHTQYSGDSLTRLEDLARAAKKAGLDRVVITDHNRLDGAKRAAEFYPDLFIPGEEILTDRGELLAAFVTEWIPRGIHWRDAIDRLKKQGAFISVSHPYDHYRHGWEEKNLAELVEWVDAIEVFNARCYFPRFNQLAGEFAMRMNLPGTAGSDGHTPWEVGRGYLELPDFSSAEELRAVIRNARVHGRLSSFWVHLTSTYAKWVKMLGIEKRFFT